AHEFVTGIGHERRPRVRYQRDGGSLAEPSDELGAHMGRTVLMIRGKRSRNAIMVEKLAGDARVFASDEVGGGKDLQRPHGNVTQIADRSGDQIESRR